MDFHYHLSMPVNSECAIKNVKQTIILLKNEKYRQVG